MIKPGDMLVPRYFKGWIGDVRTIPEGVYLVIGVGMVTQGICHVESVQMLRSGRCTFITMPYDQVLREMAR